MNLAAKITLGLIAIGIGMRAASASVKRGATDWSRGDWPEASEPYRAVIIESENKQGIPRGLLARLLWQESRFKPNAENPSGAIGIAQIIPRWHPQVGEAGARDPFRAIPYAAQYLRENYNKFGTWPLALAAYNWGPGSVSAALTNQLPVYEWPRETQNYMAEISADAGVV